MRIEVQVRKFHDWKLTHVSELQAGDVHVASNHGEDLRLKRVLVEEPSVTSIEIPDDLIERWVEDHRQGVADALIDNGPNDPARALPSKTRNQLIADHLEVGVMPYHAPAQHVRRVKITESPYPAKETKRLQRMLQARLSGEEDSK